MSGLAVSRVPSPRVTKRKKPGSSGWNLAVYVLCYAAQIPRLHAEERILSRDARYVAYQDAVRYRLIPFVW